MGEQVALTPEALVPVCILMIALLFTLGMIMGGMD